MFINRISKRAVILLILAVASVTVSFVAQPPSFPTANRSYDKGEQIPAEPAYIALERQINREYVLGERYGQRPENVSQFSAEQIRREYSLGERYGVTPQGYAREQALREYWLGERYGATANLDSSYDSLELSRSRRYEQTSANKGLNCDRAECYYQLPNGLWVR